MIYDVLGTLSKINNSRITKHHQLIDGKVGERYIIERLSYKFIVLCLKYQQYIYWSLMKTLVVVWVFTVKNVSLNWN